MRVLHVLGAMNRGGAETWLMHVLRTVDRSRLHLDFLVHSQKPAAYDEEIRALGSKVIVCPLGRNPVSYARKLQGALRQHGPYDVVHSHVHHFSGLVLAVAKHIGVPKRIAHSHSNTGPIDSSAWMPRRLYLSSMQRLIQRYATVGLAASEEAGRALWGAQWSRDSRWRIFYCGIDLVPFQSNLNKSDVRMELEIPKDTYVVGNVGRFDHPKNHMHVLQVFRALVGRMSNVRLLLVGDGPLREDIEREVTRLGLDHYVLFIGVRGDVPRLLLGGIDLMLFPSLHEGLPVVVLEAQAAGVPVVLSDVITREVEVVPKLLTWVPLSESVPKWGDACVAALRRRRDTPCEGAWRYLASGKFDIRTNVKLLESIYLDG